ncbi:putative membrane protein YuiD [Glycine soja]|uniref:Putative membrane protein YuiD n=1 Tax=Glycine soja TaxID=3848 RepID=A0A445HSN7_GLYSO|nr:putative membrane protein YuiD [Glycine soja]
MSEVLTMADVTANLQAATTASTPYALPTNLPLLSAFLSFALAQFLKIFTSWYKEKRWDSKRLLDSGGMPSSHSATVSALAVAIGLQEGAGSTAFAVAVVLACISSGMIRFSVTFVRSCMMPRELDFMQVDKQNCLIKLCANYLQNILVPMSDLCVIHLVILHFRCEYFYFIIVMNG